MLDELGFVLAWCAQPRCKGPAPSWCESARAGRTLQRWASMFPQSVDGRYVMVKHKKNEPPQDPGLCETVASLCEQEMIRRGYPTGPGLPFPATYERRFSREGGALVLTLAWMPEKTE